MSRERMPPEVAEAVIARSGGFCEAQTPHCRGVAQSLHHRKRAGRIHTENNLLHVCDYGGCHTYIHANVAESYERGWLLHSTDEISPYERTTTMNVEVF